MYVFNYKNSQILSCIYINLFSIEIVVNRIKQAGTCWIDNIDSNVDRVYCDSEHVQ